MNQIATQEERLPMNTVGVTNTSTGAKIAPQNLGEVVKFAEVMCRADIALPKHLRGNAGACMAVALQALEWQLSPFAVASKSYAVNGAIAYEAQLIAAVVNTRSGIKGRLKYRFDGQGGDLTCTVTGNLDGEECEYTSPPIGSITTKNSPLWKSDPQQQLGYFSARSWARRHCPEVILGVYDRDEAEDFRGPDKAKDITPAFDPLSDEPIGAQTALVTQQHDTSVLDEPFDHSTGEILDNTNTDSGRSPSEPEDADAPSRPAQSAEAGGDNVPAKSPASNLFPTDRADLIECCKKILSIPVMDHLEKEARRGVLESTNNTWKETLPVELHEHIRSFSRSADAQIKAPDSKLAELRQSAFELFAEMLGCTVAEIGGGA